MKKTLNHIIFFGFCAVAVLLHIYQKFLPITLVLVSLLILVYPNIKQRFKANKVKKYLVCSSVFYLLHAVGLLYSENFNYGTFDLEVKASFILLPIVLSLTPKGVIDKIPLIIKIFLFTGFFVVIYTFIFVAYEYATRDLYFTYYLYSARMSQFIHVGYLAIYLNLSIVLILASFTHRYSIAIKSILLRILMLILFTTMIVISGSKNGFIVTFIIYVSFALIYFIKIKKKSFILYSLIGLILFLSSISIFSPLTFKKFTDMFENTKTEITDKSTTGSTQIRKIAWEAAITKIKEKPLIGHGSGDVKDQLMSYYKENGYTGAYEKKMNAHNQFLQTTIGIGIVGLTSLLSLFGLLIYYARKNNDIVLGFFTLIFVLASLTESVFEVQAGVVFFNFMVMILLMRKRSAV